VKGIPSDLAMYDPLAMMENLEAFGGANGEVEKSLQRNLFLGDKFLPESLELGFIIPCPSSFVPSWAIIDDPWEVVRAWIRENADNDWAFIPLLAR
jgi:hypothetical protein